MAIVITSHFGLVTVVEIMAVIRLMVGMVAAFFVAVDKKGNIC